MTSRRGWKSIPNSMRQDTGIMVGFVGFHYVQPNLQMAGLNWCDRLTQSIFIGIGRTNYQNRFYNRKHNKSSTC
jgi:hypothetical protein